MLIIAIHQEKLLIGICDVTSCDESPCECKLFIREMKNTDRVCFTTWATWATWATGNQSFIFRILHLHLQHGQFYQSCVNAFSVCFSVFYQGHFHQLGATAFLHLFECFQCNGNFRKGLNIFYDFILKVAGWSGVQNKISAWGVTTVGRSLIPYSFFSSSVIGECRGLTFHHFFNVGRKGFPPEFQSGQVAQSIADRRKKLVSLDACQVYHKMEDLT